MNHKPIKVFKFGGASLRNSEGVKNVAEILKNYRDERLVIVVSAMGKATNELEKVVEAHAGQNGQSFPLLEEVKAKYFDIAGGLFPTKHEVFDLLNDDFVAIEWMLEEEVHENYDYMYDQIVPVGEVASSYIVHAYLQQSGFPVHWLDARDIIITDDIFRNGYVLWEETKERALRIARPLTEEPGFVLTQGFIGSTTDNFTTTLGREGSDYTAAIFSHCLDAESMIIWKDVPGVLTADPRLFENVMKLDRLSYREAIEMTYYGAKVIHPKTIKPLQNKSIPMWVKSFIEPDGPGTLITGEVDENYPPMITVEQNQSLLQIATRDFSFVAEHHLSLLFARIAELRLQVNMMQNTAISFVVSITDVPDRLQKFIDGIKKDFRVTLEKNVELITVRHYQENVLESLKEGKIVLLEERLRDTVQMVVKDVPVLRRK